jgi:hypothetical protein
MIAMANSKRPKVGAPLTFRLHFKNVTGTVKKSVVQCWNFKFFWRDLILDTSVSDGRTLNIKEDGYVDFSVNRLPLTAGSYLLSIFAEANGTFRTGS